ncbi:MAG: hypothetical protein VB053_09055 [Oscillibacter ruminantium]|uniref:DUF4376 domain-containing protein n=1 Tax=Oscillibacter ruminantium TaxID=1263547 RepID=UPI002B20E269|nr:hypothetical protein [Oscillibacter ruminantium]MEA5042669.1 hypothetical protein [Oscillibacter ruminantium]
MYITTGTSKHYTVLNQQITVDEVRYTLESAPAALGATVSLYTADGGMCLRTDTVADYQYPRIDGNTIILSNVAPAEPTKPSLSEVQKDKLAEINAACDAAITAGCDVTLSDGTAGHISLSIPDQINLTTAREAVKAGGSGYAYHLDGSLCEVYPAADIAIMAKAATAHILYHTTYCNHLRAWVSRCVAVDDVKGIAYGGALPADLAANMQTIMTAMGGGNA